MLRSKDYKKAGHTLQVLELCWNFSISYNLTIITLLVFISANNT